jgi:hypothetical protein
LDLEKAECYFEGIYKANFVAGNTDITASIKTVLRAFLCEIRAL